MLQSRAKIHEKKAGLSLADRVVEADEDDDVVVPQPPTLLFWHKW
ncbi:MAG: hypothetical protein QWI73_06155 [Alphaproteobacteria bacterium]|nr:hypothetical protein [Alphaproteobacteria bacterium]